MVGVCGGRFILQRKIQLPGGVVLQGAGPEQTIVEVPVSLTDLMGNPGLAAGEASSYSFEQAFIEAHGSDAGAVLARVTAHGARGEAFLELSSTDEVQRDQWIRIVQTDVGKTLMNRLHSDLMVAGPDTHGDVATDFHTRIWA